jgi:putative DNA primase/helicase
LPSGRYRLRTCDLLRVRTERAGRNHDAGIVNTATDQRRTVTFELTDLGNAERLVARHGDDLRYCAPWKTWLVWDGARWKADETGDAMRRAKDTARSLLAEAIKAEDDKTRRDLAACATKSEGETRLRAMLALAESELPIPVVPAQFDVDPWKLNVERARRRPRRARR